MAKPGTMVRIGENSRFLPDLDRCTAVLEAKRIDHHDPVQGQLRIEFEQALRGQLKTIGMSSSSLIQRGIFSEES